jgi:hypothetical protein
MTKSFSGPQSHIGFRNKQLISQDASIDLAAGERSTTALISTMDNPGKHPSIFKIRTYKRSRFIEPKNRSKLKKINKA